MLVTKPAPDFKAQAVMPDNSFKEVSLSDFKASSDNSAPQFMWDYLAKNRKILLHKKKIKRIRMEKTLAFRRSIH